MLQQENLFKKYLEIFSNFFKKLKRWVEELHQFGLKDTEIVIAGNKCDMMNQI
jgi:Ras-related protein Rab-21